MKSTDDSLTRPKMGDDSKQLPAWTLPIEAPPRLPTKYKYKMRTAKFKSEADMAAHVVSYLGGHRFEVFPEVDAAAGRADIVARAGKLLWVIECKLTMNFEVIEQAQRWTKHAHFVSVAVPQVRSRADGIVCDILEKYGLGLLVVNGNGFVENRMIRDPTPTTGPTPQSAALQRCFGDVPYSTLRTLGAPFRRRVLPELGNVLEGARQLENVAGSSGGTRWTPYKNTCVLLAKHVAAHPGVSLKEALGHITHHYRSESSARACLASLIGEGVVEGVFLRAVGKELLLYPAPPEDAPPLLAEDSILVPFP